MGIPIWILNYCNSRFTKIPILRLHPWEFMEEEHSETLQLPLTIQLGEQSPASRYINGLKPARESFGYEELHLLRLTTLQSIATVPW